MSFAAPPSSSSGHYLPLSWPRDRDRRHPSGGGNRSGGVCKSFARKYVLLCCLCGGLQVTLGALYLAIYFVLDGYTTSLHYFQTLPTYVPSIPVRRERDTERTDFHSSWHRVKAIS